MPGDYTRFTYDPLRDYSRVWSEQGRVVLDADLNELADGIDHRLRALALDVLGPCTAPVDLDAQPAPAVTGFEITASGSSFTIGLGRLYVHGLELDNHGPGPYHAEPGLQDARGGSQVAYEQQPYYPAPPAMPTGRHVVYIDAWDREVTAVDVWDREATAGEHSSLIDSAVGVDTSARMQTVWQVKVLPDDATGVTCDTPDSQVPGWSDATMPSAGRLSSVGVGVPAATDPCSVPPVGGYRGSDNRLYRVEIHNAGTTAAATFKWSQDNASVSTPVTDIDLTRTLLTVVSTGRDDSQRIREQAWVEILDDYTELSGAPGFLSLVQSVTPVDDVTQQVMLQTPLPASFDPATSSRHTRLRQWDQTGADVNADGTINVAAALSGLVLEDGVQITFSDDPAGGLLKTGDYWTFAARAADASVQVLTAAPPQGPRHFYGRLAIVDLPDEVVDCRGVWPPPPSCECSGDCTVCVTPQTHASGQLTIQTAVSQVSATGGTVCLAAGEYGLTAPVVINGAYTVTIRGQGLATRLECSDDSVAAAIIVENSLVTICDLAVVVGSAQGSTTAQAIGIAVNSGDVRLEGVSILDPYLVTLYGVLNFGPQLSPTNVTGQGIGIALGGYVRISIHECLLVFRLGIAPLYWGPGTGGLTINWLVLESLQISECTIWAPYLGIAADEEQAGFISGAQVRDSTVSTLGTCISWHAASMDGSNLSIIRSTLTATDQAAAGLELACSGTVVRGCTITGAQTSTSSAITLVAPVLAANLADVSIRDCLLSGYMGVSMSGGSLQDVEIAGCTVTGVSSITIYPSSGLRVTVRDNDVRLNWDPQASLYGITLAQVTDAVVRGNRVRSIPYSIAAGQYRTMISLYGCPSLTVSGNIVTDLMPVSMQGTIGIYVYGSNDVDIVNNVIEVGEGVAFPADQFWNAFGLMVFTYGTVQQSATAPQTAQRDLRNSIATPANGSPLPRQVYYVRTPTQTMRVTSQAVLLVASTEYDATTVLGNRFELNGGGSAAQITGSGSLMFNDNRVRHEGVAGASGYAYPCVNIGADSLTASGNRIEGPLTSMVADAQPIAILGNLTSNVIMSYGVPITAPWNALNAVTP